MQITKRLVLSQLILICIETTSCHIYLKQRDDVIPFYLRQNGKSNIGNIFRKSDESNKGLSIVDSNEQDLKKSESEKENDDDSELSGLNLNTEQLDMLRKRWRSKCDKKASKVCRKACIDAYKSACGVYRCERSLKKRFKKECKRNCKSRFLSGRDDTESE